MTVAQSQHKHCDNSRTLETNKSKQIIVFLWMRITGAEAEAASWRSMLKLNPQEFRSNALFFFSWVTPLRLLNRKFIDYLFTNVFSRLRSFFCLLVVAWMTISSSPQLKNAAAILTSCLLWVSLIKFQKGISIFHDLRQYGLHVAQV